MSGLTNYYMLFFTQADFAVYLFRVVGVCFVSSYCCATLCPGKLFPFPRVSSLSLQTQMDTSFGIYSPFSASPTIAASIFRITQFWGNGLHTQDPREKDQEESL